MLVLSRKKSEAILIDGVIRIEVVNMAKATVRVRLTAPRSLQLPHGGCREGSPGSTGFTSQDNSGGHGCLPHDPG